MNILPSRGLKINSNFISFGILKEDVEKLLGKADKVYTTDFGNIRWQYYHHLIEFSFEKTDNYSLGWIEVYNKKAKIFDREFIGKNKKYVIDYFNTKLQELPDFEDYNSFETFFYDKASIELQFEFNKLHNINFGN